MAKLSQTKIKVLDQFESRTDFWRFGEFEHELERAMGARYGNYQTAKSTICQADKEGRWPNTVRRYVLTNYSAFGTSPGELVDVCSRLLSGMLEEEKGSWGIKST